MVHLQSTTEVMLDLFVGLKYRFRGSQWGDVYQGRGIKLSYEDYDACAAGLWSCDWGMCCACVGPHIGSGRCREVVRECLGDAPRGSEHARERHGQQVALGDYQCWRHVRYTLQFFFARKLK